MVLGTTGRNDTLATSPLTSISAWCSTGWYFAVYNSAANKVCCNQTFCLLVLINITDMDLDFTFATHIFTTIPCGKLWCSACFTRHTALGCILVVCPCTVMTKFLGMQIGFFLEPVVTSPMCPVTSSKFCWSFFYTGHLVLGILLVLIAGTQVEKTLPIHCFYLCLSDGTQTTGRTVKD